MGRKKGRGSFCEFKGGTAAPKTKADLTHSSSKFLVQNNDPRPLFFTTIKNAQGRLSSGPGSGQFDKELARLTRESATLDEFNIGLKELVNRWKIDPKLLPEPYPQASGG